MKQKIKKALYEYTKNSRITTKELGKRINASQQSASYLINSLKTKNLIQDETTIVDAVKLGYINTLIGFNYIKLDNQTRKEVINKLKIINEVIAIEESREGIDILIEVSTQNLAAFHKVYIDLVTTFNKQLKTAFTFPIITKYKYSKKYLKQPKTQKVKILFGDKLTKDLTKNENLILQELVKNPSKRIIDISTKTKLIPKSVIKIKKELEKKFIIKGYSAVLDNKSLEIQREIFFLRFQNEGIKDLQNFLNYAKTHKNITEIIKVIGSSQLIVIVENINQIDIIREIRSLFPVESYMIFKSEKIHKKTYLPLK